LGKINLLHFTISYIDTNLAESFPFWNLLCYLKGAGLFKVKKNDNIFNEEL
jgi:hypothetical protein